MIAPARSQHYQFETLGEGVIAGVARPQGTALSNTALVDLGGATLVFDTSLTLESAREILAASVALTHRPPTLAANSHWHLDHILGNQLFSDHPVHATRRTIEILHEKRSELEAELRPAKLEADILELETQQNAANTAAGRAPYEPVLRIHRRLLSEAAERRLTPPTSGFDVQLRLPGDRGASLRSFGSGHTESDAVLYVERTRSLLAGDLVVAGNHPNLTSGDPEHWLKVLDELEKLRPDRVVPGHGPVGSVETIREVRDYLTTLLRLAETSGHPEIPARFRAWAEPDQFTSNLAYVRSRAVRGRPPASPSG